MPNVPSSFVHARDPDDALYDDVAVAAQATFLVSRDKDLLDLMNDPSFCQQHPNLEILDPVPFLATVPKDS